MAHRLKTAALNCEVQLCETNLGQKYWLKYLFLEIINEEFKYNTLFELKQTNEYFVEYRYELQDGR